MSKELADRLDALDTYKHKNYVSSSKYVYDAMLEVAKQNNLFDHSIYSEYLSIKTILDNLYFLNTIFSMIRGSSYYGDGTTDQVRIIVDLMKYHKMRVNLEHYSKPKLEEKVEEELLESLENQ